MTNTPQMLPGGSNPEGVAPNPPLAWTSTTDLKDVVAHGPALSHATTKLRTFFVFAGLPYWHEQHLKAKQQGIKPNSSYRKVPVIEVAGRQVNDSWIILQTFCPRSVWRWTRHGKNGSFCHSIRPSSCTATRPIGRDWL